MFEEFINYYIEFYGIKHDFLKESIELNRKVYRIISDLSHYYSKDNQIYHMPILTYTNILSSSIGFLVNYETVKSILNDKTEEYILNAHIYDGQYYSLDELKDMNIHDDYRYGDYSKVYINKLINNMEKIKLRMKIL